MRHCKWNVVKVCIVAVTLLSLVTTITANTRPVTMMEVVNQSLFDNPALRAAQANEMAKHHEVRQAVGNFLPKINVHWARGYENSNNPTLSAIGITAANLWREENDVVLDQPLFAGGRNVNTFNQRRYELQTATEATNNTKQSVMLQIIEAYLNVLRYRSLVALGVRNVTVHRRTLAKVKLRFEGGAGDKSEMALARSRLALARSRLQNFQGLLQEANARYFAVTAFYPVNGMKMPNSYAIKLPRTEKEAVTIALDKNPLLLSAEATTRSARANVNVVQANLFPQVDFQLSASDNSNVDGIIGSNKDVLGLLVVTFNLFNGGSDFFARKAAKDRSYQSQDDLENTQRSVIESVKSTWASLFTSRKQIVSLGYYAAQSKLVVVNYIEQFKIGKRALFNVLDAENELFNARTALANARYDAAIDVYRLLADMGVLTQLLADSYYKKPEVNFMRHGSQYYRVRFARHSYFPELVKLSTARRTHVTKLNKRRRQKLLLVRVTKPAKKHAQLKKQTRMVAKRIHSIKQVEVKPLRHLAKKHPTKHAETKVNAKHIVTHRRVRVKTRPHLKKNKGWGHPVPTRHHKKPYIARLPAPRQTPAA